MDIKVSFDAAAVTEALAQAPDNVVVQMRQALNESCRLVQRGARQVHRFKSRTSQLERAISFRVDLAKNEGIVEITKTIAPYGEYVHEGTRPHMIRPKNKKALRFTNSNGDFVFSRMARHPGTRPDQFLYKSGERNRTEINAIFGRHISTAIKGAGL